MPRFSLIYTKDTEVREISAPGAQHIRVPLPAVQTRKPSINTSVMRHGASPAGRTGCMFSALAVHSYLRSALPILISLLIYSEYFFQIIQLQRRSRKSVKSYDVAEFGLTYVTVCPSSARFS